MKNISFYVIIALLVCGFFCTISPYPIFSTSTNLTESDREEINAHGEVEQVNKSLTVKEHSTLSSIPWQSVAKLIPIGDEISLYDLTLKKKLNFVRIGGVNHADIVPLNREDLIACQSVTDLTKHSCFVMLENNIILPASLDYNFHGYNQENSQTHGHLCLHFEGSKTDGTQSQQKSHIEAINMAKKKFSKVKNLF